MKNFWQELKKPIIALAPMADVTDAAFRQIIAEKGRPDVFYTEFVSADGLCLAPEGGRKKLLKDLEYSPLERPIVAQFFTGRPEIMERVASLALELGFDGVDINMGCPDQSIEKQGAGAALMRNYKFAKELIRAAKKGVKNKIPISVKTRIGYNKDELQEWLPELLQENPAAIILHLRTRKEMSKVPAHWEWMKTAIEIRNKMKSETIILGNGDLHGVKEAVAKCKETGADGAMLGRAIFGNPWLFAKRMPNKREKIETLIEHSRLFEEKFAGFKSFAVMKKHFKSYLSGIENSKEILSKLMEAENSEEVAKILHNFAII